MLHYDRRWDRLRTAREVSDAGEAESGLRYLKGLTGNEVFSLTNGRRFSVINGEGLPTLSSFEDSGSVMADV